MTGFLTVWEESLVSCRSSLHCFSSLSLLEDSGYMARVAFIMDKLLRKLGSVGKKYRADAGRVRMYRSRGDGEQNASVGKRQENDDFADSVYELYGKASDLCILFGCIFSRTMPRL